MRVHKEPPVHRVMFAIVLALATAIGVLWAIQAYAKQLPIGVELQVAHATVCDSKEQVLDILIAHEMEGYSAGMAVLDKYQSTENAEGEAACGSIVGTIVIEAREATFVALDFPTGARSVYVLRLRLNGNTYYAISFIDVEAAI